MNIFSIQIVCVFLLASVGCRRAATSDNDSETDTVLEIESDSGSSTNEILPIGLYPGPCTKESELTPASSSVPDYLLTYEYNDQGKLVRTESYKKPQNTVSEIVEFFYDEADDLSRHRVVYKNDLPGYRWEYRYTFYENEIEKSVESTKYVDDVYASSEYLEFDNHGSIILVSNDSDGDGQRIVVARNSYVYGECGFKLQDKEWDTETSTFVVRYERFMTPTDQINEFYYETISSVSNEIIITGTAHYNENCQLLEFDSFSYPDGDLIRARTVEYDEADRMLNDREVTTFQNRITQKTNIFDEAGNLLETIEENTSDIESENSTMTYRYSYDCWK